MKMRIIKRVDREKVVTEVPKAEEKTKSVETRAEITATVNSWIDERRQKRDNERLLIQQLFS